MVTSGYPMRLMASYLSRKLMTEKIYQMLHLTVSDYRMARSYT
jgi:hypothetical protein